MNQINQIEMLARCSTISSEPTEYLWIEMLVDDRVIVDFKYYAVDLDELLRSIHSNGEFFILTCWCGVPECAGIEKGVQVNHENDFIFWKLNEPKQFSFTFEHRQYETEVRKVMKQSKRLLADTKHTGSKSPEIVPMQNEEHFRFN